MLPPVGDLVDLVSDDVRLTTLLSAVQAAGLQSTLSAPGPFTLLAPTNEAFAKLDPATLNTILQDPNILASVLTYHVLPGTACSAGLMTSSVRTLNGGDVQVVVGVAGVEVNSAQVITADIAVTNGVVHLIDTVLLPPGLVLPGEYWFISKCIFFILKLTFCLKQFQS